jgi:RecA/RadA recombinase
MDAAAAKATLEELLQKRRLAPEGPPLRGLRRSAPLSTGHAELDERLGGGLPRGRVSEAFGPASSGRTALCLAAAARVTGTGGLVAWVDPQDRLDPASAASSGVELQRVLWLRGAAASARALPEAVQAVATCVLSGLFDLVALDLAGVPAAEIQRLPAATWLRLQRALETKETALLLMAAQHVAKSPLGAQLRFEGAGPRFEGQGPGRLLVSVRAAVRPGPLSPRGLPIEILAVPPAR